MNKLKFHKTVLSKVSFSQSLFRKEYEKAMGELSRDEQRLLKRWVRRFYQEKAPLRFRLQD